MTFREKLEMDHPEAFTRDENGHIIPQLCPSDFGYCEREGDCYGVKCSDCWNRNVPEDVNIGKVESEKTEPTIKDSGDRTQFESGAVRDMREGKGRFDLVPLEVVAKLMDDNPSDPDLVVGSIALFMNSGCKHTVHLYRALHYVSERCYKNSADMFLDAAKHFEAGAKKYGPDNWRKSIPAWCYVDSAVRHYLKWRRGDNDENHTAACAWNLMCCIWEVDYGEEWRKNRKED